MFKLLSTPTSRLICLGGAKTSTMAVEEPGIKEPDSELNFV